MKITKETAQLVLELEELIGDNVYNKESYNGYTGEQGAHYRYPVTYPKKDGTFGNSKYGIYDVDLKNIDQMHYKFGANQLYVGVGIIRLLNELEDRFDLDFNNLTRKNKEDATDGFMVIPDGVEEDLPFI